VYLICGVPIEQMSGWLLGCATEIFTSFEEFHTFLSNTLSNTTVVTVTGD
jgi:hypothetical protein